MSSPMLPNAARATRRPATHRFTLADRPAARDNGIGNSDLPVALERARLHGEGAGGCRRLSKPVNDSYARAEPCQPQRQHEARRSRSDDEDVGHDGRARLNRSSRREQSLGLSEAIERCLDGAPRAALLQLFTNLFQRSECCEHRHLSDADSRRAGGEQVLRRRCAR